MRPPTRQMMADNDVTRLADTLNGAFPRLPRFIGVAEHRDLPTAQLPTLKTLVNNVLNEQRSLEPSVPLVVLSTLSEGADRLVADCVLAAGGDLIALLPTPLEEYVQTFRSDESLRDFSKLLARARHQVEIRHQCAITPNTLPDYSQFPKAHDETLLRFIATHCHIVIAFSDRTAGTPGADMPALVRYRLEGIATPSSPLLSALDRFGAGIVYYIRLHSVDGSSSGTLCSDTSRHFPCEVEQYGAFFDTYTHSAKRFADYNTDAVRFLHSPAAACLKHACIASSPAPIHSPACTLLAFHYVVADALAVHFQRLTKRMLHGLTALALSGVLCLQLHSWVNVHHAIVVIGYLASLGLAWGVYAVSRHSRYESKAREYRALAEALRVQSIWEVAGIARCAAEFYLHTQITDMYWVRDALRSAYLCAVVCRPRGAIHEHSLDPPRMAVVRQQWILPQLQYYSHASAAHQKVHKRLQRISQVFVAVSIALAILHLFMPASHMALAAFGFAPAVAALLHIYRRHGACEELGKHYARMARRFAQAAGIVEQPTQNAAADPRDVVLSLGVDALRENGDWCVLRRDRPLNAMLPTPR